MNRTWTFTSAVIVAAMSVAVLPAGAQGRERGGRPGGGGQGGGGQAPRQQSAQQAAPRQAPPQARQQTAPPQARQAAPRPSENRQYQAPPQAQRSYESRPLPTAPQATPRAYENRQYSGAQAMPRGDGSRLYSAAPPPANMTRPNQAQPRGDARSYGQGPSQAQPRVEQRPNGGAPNNGRGAAYGSNSRGGYGQPQSGSRSPYGANARPNNYGHPNSYYARPYHSRAYVRPPHYAPYRPYYFGHSYYSFRPYWNIGFGLWVGYSVPYPYGYFYAGYAPRVYGTYYSTTNYYSGSDYYGIEPYMARPAVSVYGGVSFDIQPSDADLFIDGEYVGTVGTFSPTGEPLTLTPGEHRIAIQRNGYRPMEWDVTIEPGQVIPYRGVMEKL